MIVPFSLQTHTFTVEPEPTKKTSNPKTQPIPPTADEQPPPAESFQFVNSFQFRPIKINFMLLSNKATLGRPSPSQSRPQPIVHGSSGSAGCRGEGQNVYHTELIYRSFESAMIVIMVHHRKEWDCLTRARLVYKLLADWRVGRNDSSRDWIGGWDIYLQKKRQSVASRCGITLSKTCKIDKSFKGLKVDCKMENFVEECKSIPNHNRFGSTLAQMLNFAQRMLSPYCITVTVEIVEGLEGSMVPLERAV